MDSETAPSKELGAAICLPLGEVAEKVQDTPSPPAEFSCDSAKAKATAPTFTRSHNAKLRMASPSIA